MESIKETAANIAASAISGKEKTKATVEEKVEKAAVHDPIQKEMATQKKEDKIRLAELEKQEAYHHNALVRQGDVDDGYIAKGTAMRSTTGGHQMPASAGHGPRQVVEGSVEFKQEVHLVTNPGVAEPTPHHTHGNYS